MSFTLAWLIFLPVHKTTRSFGTYPVKNRNFDVKKYDVIKVLLTMMTTINGSGLGISYNKKKKACR